MAKKKKNKTKKVMRKKISNKKKKGKLSSPKVKVIVNSSFNNTIVSVCDYKGNVIATSSGGAVGFTGSRKSTGYAATRAGMDAAQKAMNQGANEAIVIVKGMGEGRNSAVKGVRAAGLRISSMSDHTPIRHGGVKPRRRPKK